jgi:hypothetical protein
VLKFSPQAFGLFSWSEDKELSVLSGISGTPVRAGTYYAVQRWGLRCRYEFLNLSAARFVYRYVINWRRDFKLLAQNSQIRLHSGKNSNKSFK